MVEGNGSSYISPIFPPCLNSRMLVFNLLIASISLAISLREEEEVDEETPFKYSDAWKSIFIVRNLFLPAMLIEFPKRVC